MHLAVATHVVTTPSQNVIADTPGGRGDRIVVFGAQLDGRAGTGDQRQRQRLGCDPRDRQADQAARHLAHDKIRFAWWGGEEFRLLGSEYYVSHLTASELKNIALNLNFDVIASPNFVRFVYDGDGSGTGTKGPTGSGNIEKVFVD
jgi:hypothetical protein